MRNLSIWEELFHVLISGVQYCGFLPWLLQRAAVWRAGRDPQQASTGTEQPGESRVPARWSSWCRTPSAVTTLVASETSHHIAYKTAVIAHKVLATSTPAYLSELIHIAEPPRLLRSSHASLLSVPRTRTQISRRAFSVAAPSVWNTLPDNTRLCKSTDTFKRHLKAHLFNTP